MRDLSRTRLAMLFNPGALVVANDAAPLPASLRGIHVKSRQEIEMCLSGWLVPSDPTLFLAIAFGSGDHRTRTGDRLPHRRCQQVTFCGLARLKQGSSASASLDI